MKLQLLADLLVATKLALLLNMIFKLGVLVNEKYNGTDFHDKVSEYIRLEKGQNPWSGPYSACC